MPAGFELLRSLTKHEQEPIEAPIEGSIPSWLEGTLYRNGPGRFEYGEKNYEHLFDGHACIHKFKIENGRVVYSNRFLDTQSFKKTLAEKRLYPVFGTVDVCSNVFERCKSFFKFPETFDNVNVNIVPFATDQVYALTETNYMCLVDPATLEIKSRIDVTDYIASTATTFAHPHITSSPDGDGVSWITMGMNTKSPRWRYEFIRYRAPHKTTDTVQSSNSDECAPHLACEKAEIIASLPSTHSFGLSYFHSFGLTQNYIVFLEQSLVFDMKQMFSCILFNKPFSHALIMKKNFEARIHLININTGEIHKQQYITDPLFVFHHINAYETKENIFVDFCGFDVNKFDINKLTYADVFTERHLSQNMNGTARRITIPISLPFNEQPIRCELKELNADVFFELPTINYDRFNGRAYKFFYGANLFKKPFSIIKMNVDNPTDVREMKYADVDEEYLPSEPIFVESPNAVEEDDGLILVMVLSRKHDFLSVLDAHDLKEIARARVPDHVKAAFTFHGFFAKKDLLPKLN